MKQFLIIFTILLSFNVFGQEVAFFEEKELKLRYENRQFFQGENEITYNEFYQVIKSSKKQRSGIYRPVKYVLARYLFLPYLLPDVDYLSPLRQRMGRKSNIVWFASAGMLCGAVILGPRKSGDFLSFDIEPLLGGLIGGISGAVINKFIRQKFQNREYRKIEEKRFRRIIKRYNKSLKST